MSIAPEQPNGYKKYLPGGEKPMAPDARRRLLMVGAIAFVIGIFIIPSSSPTRSSRPSPTRAAPRREQHMVFTSSINSSTGRHHRQVEGRDVNYTSNGPNPVLPREIDTLETGNNVVTFANPGNLLGALLPYLILVSSSRSWSSSRARRRTRCRA